MSQLHRQLWCTVESQLIRLLRSLALYTEQNRAESSDIVEVSRPCGGTGCGNELCAYRRARPL